MKVPVSSRSRTYIRATNKPSIEQYFCDITSSKEAAINFIKNNMANYTRANGYTASRSYYSAMVKATNVLAKQDAFAIYKNYNYTAFVSTVAKLGLVKREIHYLWDPISAKRKLLPGSVFRDAEEVFAEKTASEEAVKNFMAELAKYPNKPKISRERQKYLFTYSQWFRDHTTAKGIRSTHKLNPVSVDWSSFIQTCNQKFNYTVRDITRLFREAE